MKSIDTPSEASRRSFLKKLGLASTGIVAGSTALTGCASRVFNPATRRPANISELGESRVSLVPGNDHAEIVRAALDPFKDEVAAAIQDKQVIIKLNCVRPSREIVGTHHESLHGVLEFLRPIYDRPVIVGEATADKVPARGIYDHFGYTQYEKQYSVKFAEFNDYPVSWEWILDADMNPIPIRVLQPFVDPDFYLISLTKFKTHNCVVTTLTSKNVTMGAPQKILPKNINDKAKMHATSKGNGSPKMLNFNLLRVAHRVRPDLCVIDGFQGMEGNGPSDGNAVDSRVALAGFDFVSVDRIGTELMGVAWEDVGYLQWCATAGLGQGEKSKIKIIGPDPAKYVKEYKLHDNIKWQMTWQDDLVLAAME